MNRTGQGFTVDGSTHSPGDEHLQTIEQRLRIERDDLHGMLARLIDHIEKRPDLMTGYVATDVAQARELTREYGRC